MGRRKGEHNTFQEILTADNTDGYARLRAAIVKQAVEDYRRALRRELANGNETERMLCSRANLERFFRSDWGRQLCGMQMEPVLEQMQKEALLCSC